MASSWNRLFRLDPLGRLRDVEVGGEREGWLHIGDFFQSKRPAA